MSDDPTTQELRIEQLRREVEERRLAEDTPSEDETAQHGRRAERAAYLRARLDERAEAERRAAEQDAGRREGPAA